MLSMLCTVTAGIRRLTAHAELDARASRGWQRPSSAIATPRPGESDGRTRRWCIESRGRATTHPIYPWRPDAADGP